MLSNVKKLKRFTQVKKMRDEAGENTPEAKVCKRTSALITALNQLDESQRAEALSVCIGTIRAGVKVVGS